MKDNYTLPLVASFRMHRDEEIAGWMAGYMKNKFDFLGIKTPLRKILFDRFIIENGLPEVKNLSKVITGLWKLPEREFQYAAISLLDKFRKTFGAKDITLIQKIIVEKSWWDTVDGIAAWFAGDYFRIYPEAKYTVTRKWMDSENIWLQRTALLFQLRYKQHTDEKLLFSYINELTRSKEFFIRKAIGWALREYSKTNPDAVLRFVAKTQMASLSKKEALKVIERKKK